MSDEFNVRQYGAKGDSITVDTTAIQQAVDACHSAGGGYVVLSGGTFVSGTIFLRSNVYLQVNPSAVLLASPDISDFVDGPIITATSMRRTWINASFMLRMP
ncbi:glycosyl hydrolase family 28-related protein [Paenibacillus sp. PK3_47]|uniref:glycosyl hydrolase family 28-related protein n=1 Tax=Paenibacillus sp. PK3_47 TaxID=2072642 RepID=UPI00201D3DC2|nr:glycosyl hydrolase family 28-related protein [Paenibacillus sp. PK3_47]